MNREQALTLANTIIGEWLEAPKNSRGYPVDGWKVPTLMERTDAVAKLAEFLWEPEMPSLLVAPEQVEPHVHSASCHGAIGELQCGQE
jgi:hypothetical protein